MTQADAMRKLIVSQAVNAIYRGGHYLAGTTGQYTGETDPRSKRTLESVNDPSLAKLDEARRLNETMCPRSSHQANRSSTGLALPSLVT
jgi:hypothetical protein